MSFQIYTAGGNLTSDPEMKYVKDVAKTSFSIAINERRGEREEVIFVDVECWDGQSKTATNVAEYKRKGDYVVIIGRWKMDEWEGEDGKKRRKWYVRADQVKFEGNKPRDDGGSRRSRDDDRRDDRPRRDTERSSRDYDDLPF